MMENDSSEISFVTEKKKKKKKKKSDLVFLNSQNIFYMKPLSRGAVGKKKAAVKGAEAP